MNKNLHRLIFNHARGLRMAVQETASTCGKANGATALSGQAGPVAPSPTTSLTSLVAALLVGLAGSLQFVSIAHAQIVADPSVPGNQRPTVLAAPNGVPLVNIQTPSAAGVSRNTYSQFDVNAQGVILNNARTNAQTQLGGWVQGNPWLAGGAARVILNEVNSSSPSHLRGFVEVGGSRAEVVIANPAGVNVNGGGFINASRATITTGTPVINGGNLEGYVVQKGLVSISGAGLDSSQTDFTGIIARAVEVNAGIWAKELKVTAGANQVDATQSAATPIAGNGAAPAFALDVSALGGMYAGKITLVGTEAGVGVRNAGTIGASAGEVVVTADGMLHNSGRIASSTAMRLGAAGGISNTASGTIYSTGDTTVGTSGNISNAGLIGAQGNTTVAATGAASQVSSAAGSVLAAGLQQDGNLAAPGIGTGKLTVSATQSIAAKGQNLSAGAQTLSARSIDIAGSQGSADSLSLAAGAGGIDAASAVIGVTQGLSVTTPGLLRTDAAKISAGQVTVNARDISNVGGEIVQAGATGAASFTVAGQLNNTLGLISAAGTLDIRDPAAGSDPAVNATGKTLAITNTGGTLIAGQALAIDAASLSSDGKVLSQGDLSAKLLGNHTHTASAQFQAAGNASLETTGTLTNQGQLLSSQGLTLKAGTLNNQATGEIRGSTVKLIATDANTLTNRGLIDGVETVIETVTLNNLGTGRIYGDHVAIAATTLNNLAEGGTAPVIAARNRLDIGATTINNAEHALVFSGGDMAIGGSLDGAKQATGQATTLNNGSATIEALGNLTINAAQINNTNNHFSTQVVPVSSEGVTEFEGSGSGVRYLAGTPGLTIYNDESDHLATPDGGRYESWSMYQYTRSISETVVTASDPGQILSGSSMTINAVNVLNDKSRIIAGGALNVTAASVLNTEVAGQRVITDAGSVTSYWRNHKSGRDDTGSSGAAYSPAAVVIATSLTPTVYQQNTAPAGTGTSINARTLVSLGQGASVATGSPNIGVPNNSLFRTNPNAAGNFLIETDPRFASYRQWLSSDYMLNALSMDPALTQKRLGDGFYEQKLIREQIAELTGRRFLDGYQSDEAQYQALMANSVTFAQQYKLRPGIALSAAQMAQLTSDIVWLVERDVTLPDGTITKALVPQVYVRVKDGDLTGDGALISASAVNLNLSGDLLNSGTIAGRNVVSLTAQNVNNLAGRIRGADVSVAATNDLNNIGGQIIATDSLLATAGRDLNIASTTSTQTSNQGSSTNIDRVAGLYVSNPGGVLVASAGRDANIIAGVISNSGVGGNTVIAAGRDLNLGTVTESSSNTIRWDANNYRSDSRSMEVGSSIQAAGNIQLSAGNDLSARAAQVSSSQGTLSASAGNSINITAGQSSQSLDEGHQHTSKGFLSKKTTTTRDTMDRVDAVGSAFSGNTVTMLTGKDISIQGSNVVSDSGTTLVAGNNISIEAAQNTFSSTSLKDEKKSGIFSGGGLSITAGKQQQSTDQKNTRTSAAASTVGSIGGDVTIQAGGAYKQVGSDVMAPGGDISIMAKKVDIIEARETSNTVTEQKFKQSGLTLAITSPVISAIQTAQQMSQAAGDTSDSRMQLLAAANVGLAANNAAKAIERGQGSVMNGKEGQIATGGKNPDGTPASRDANAADQVGGINLSLNIGGSKSQSTSTSQSDTARGSSVTAGGNVAIIATGAGQDSNLTIQGSAVEAGKSALLFADNQIKLLAAKNEASQQSSNSASSGSIGISVGTDGFMVNASVSKARGNADGTDTSYTSTQVRGGGNTGDMVIVQSGGDTTVKGAIIAANTVKADVGGNLNIESLQDTSTYTGKQQSAGGSISVGAGNMSGSISLSKSNIDSDFASVTQQSGIKAGDGGFQVDVQGNTDLKGAVIASTDTAVNNRDNTFTTGGELTTSDIQNTASYSGKSVGISVGAGYTGSTTSLNGTGVGIGKNEGNSSSTTSSGISGVAANTAVRSTDAETGLKPIFDADKVQREINAQVAITQAFSKEAPKAVASFAAGQAAELRKQGNEEEAKKWDENGTYRIALHTATGALGGGLSGAAGAAASASTANLMNELQDSIQQSLQAAGLNEGAAKVLAQGVATLTAAGVGSVIGGVHGAATAATVDANNRALHPTDKQLAAKLAAKGKYTKEQIEEQMRLMGNSLLGVGPNTVEILIGPDAVGDNLSQDPGMPKVVDGTAVIQVPGQANFEIQQYIIGNTKEDAGYIPGVSQYVMSNISLNGPTITNIPSTLPTASCANNDLACKSGVGVQQNTPLTEQAREELANASAILGRQAGVIAAVATAVGSQAGPYGKSAQAIAIAATAVNIGADAVEQVLRPNVKQVIRDQLVLGVPAEVLTQRFPLLAPWINEVKESLK